MKKVFTLVSFFMASLFIINQIYQADTNRCRTNPFVWFLSHNLT